METQPPCPQDALVLRGHGRREVFSWMLFLTADNSAGENQTNSPSENQTNSLSENQIETHDSMILQNQL